MGHLCITIILVPENDLLRSGPDMEGVILIFRFASRMLVSSTLILNKKQPWVANSKTEFVLSWPKGSDSLAGEAAIHLHL